MEAESCTQVAYLAQIRTHHRTLRNYSNELQIETGHLIAWWPDPGVFRVVAKSSFDSPLNLTLYPRGERGN
jgi:hypothetical protein